LKPVLAIFFYFSRLGEIERIGEVYMGKQGEVAYLQNIGEEGRTHAFNKPFSDDNCGAYLMDLGSIMTLLPSPPCKLLDLGIGTGWTSLFFAQRGYDVTGQDIAVDMIALAEKNKSRYNIDSLKFITCDYEDLPFEKEFDCAVFYDSLHHSVDVYQALAAVYRSLKPGGIFIAIEPGSGHSKSKESIKAMELWGVTEKDMPPSLIIKAGKKAGFKSSKVYLRHNKPFEIFSSFSLEGLATAAKTFLRYLPGLGTLKSNITVLAK
jgi:SAM-dependent methyltransferase